LKDVATDKLRDYPTGPGATDADKKYYNECSDSDNVFLSILMTLLTGEAVACLETDIAKLREFGAGRKSFERLDLLVRNKSLGFNQTIKRTIKEWPSTFNPAKHPSAQIAVYRDNNYELGKTKKTDEPEWCSDMIYVLAHDCPAAAKAYQRELAELSSTDAELLTFDMIEEKLSRAWGNAPGTVSGGGALNAIAPAPATDATTVLTDQVRVLTENMSVLMAAFQHVPRNGAGNGKDKHGEGWCDKCRYRHSGACKECKKCKKFGHLENVCRSGKTYAELKEMGVKCRKCGTLGYTLGSCTKCNPNAVAPKLAATVPTGFRMNTPGFMGMFSCAGDDETDLA
jgi:hypothetical protein